MKETNACDLEIGNLMFHNNTIQSYLLPNYAYALLKDFRERLDNVIGYEDNPFGNTGSKFQIDGVFEIEAYSWDDEHEQPYNFKYKDIEISWYKYFGRDTTINGDYSPEQIIQMYDDCIEALDKYARENKKGMYEDDVWF